MKTKDEVLAALVDIQKRINQKIPQPSNRYNDLECIPKEMDLEDAIAKLKDHRLFISSKRIEHELGQRINTTFISLTAKKGSAKESLTEEDWAQLENSLLIESEHICKKLERTLKYLEEDKKINAHDIEAAIKSNISRLRCGENLSINTDLLARFEDDEQLAEHRSICDRQFTIPNYLLTDNIEDREQLETAKKIYYLWRAVYFSKAHIHVGYCDEHACLTLKELFDEELFTGKEGSIEKVAVEYGEGVSHTFLAWNREKDSPLEDINAWGKDAIIVDPWNRITCFASEYESLPVRYPLFHKNGKWSTIKFTREDQHLLWNLTNLDIYWTITGNESPEVRLPLIMEEYQLTSLETAEYRETKAFLSALTTELTPNGFGLTVECFITSSNPELVCVINGFNEPKIAINKELLANLPAEYSFDELRFGLARALFQIKYHGCAAKNEISAEEHHYLDKLALAKCKHANAAISYLRKSNHFDREYKGSSKIITRLSPERRLRCITESTYEQRIKNLMTLLANDESLRVDCAVTGHVAANIVTELMPIKEQFFFKDKFSACKTDVEKIEYLTTCFPALKTELLPYELRREPGIRIRHFCRLLAAIQISVKDPDQVKAADVLVNRALELRVPGFDLIYLVICQVNPDKYPPPLPAFGLFHTLQKAINRFVAANKLEQIETATQQVDELLQLLKFHFKSSGRVVEKHIRKYKKTHDHALPKDTDRYFGSDIGEYIHWTGFKPNKNNELPWEYHISCALQSDKPLIAQILWQLGVTRDKRLLKILDMHTLFKLAHKEPLIRLPGNLSKYGHLSYKQDPSFDYPLILLNHLSSQHVLITDMFNKSMSFKDAVETFISLNMPALASTGFREKLNVDNPTIRYLLKQFANIAANGSEEDKLVVKDFFLNNKSKSGLHELTRTPKKGYYLLPYTLFAQFVVEQQFNTVHFKLFTHDEIIQFIRTHYLTRDMPPAVYISVYNLPFMSLTLPCLTELIPLLIKDKLECVFSVINGHLQTTKYTISDASAAKVIGLAFDYGLYPNQTKTILKQFGWDFSLKNKANIILACSDLITIYRAHDTFLLFPNHEEQAGFGRILRQKIREITDPDTTIKALEELLYARDNKFVQLGDHQLRAFAIELLVEEFFKIYGIDQGDDSYFKTITPVIDRVFKLAYKPDKYAILSRLAVRIESQSLVSEYIGVLFEPEKYLLISKDSGPDPVIGTLANICQIFSDNLNDQHHFLEYMSSPLTEQSINTFSQYLFNNKKLNDFFEATHHDHLEKPRTEKEIQQRLTTIHFMVKGLYYEFWDLSITQRAVVMDYLLIPAKTVDTAKSSQKAYQEAFSYVTQKLFPRAGSDSDENFAIAILESWLDAADTYVRSYLLSGMLIASNAAQNTSSQSGIGKKLVMICEHMGPAYIKLAQTIHSHPDAPDYIRVDLQHIKGRANPPCRWQLWRLINDVVSAHERNNIQRVGLLLGSASYNLALAVTLKNGVNAVLSLRREHAAEDAKKGFNHLQTTIQACQHPRMKVSRGTVLSMLTEASKLSDLEMDSKASEKQYKLAAQMYPGLFTIDVNNISFKIDIKPVPLLSSGEGYRFIGRAYGVEYNEFPKATPGNRLVRRAIAKVVITKELTNILAGHAFDSDRHGNQLRIEIDPLTHKIILGLYDFGELSLDKPDETELHQLACFIRDLPSAIMKSLLFSSCFDSLMSSHINTAIDNGHSPAYLMRVRKAFLALQDFQADLSTLDLIEIIKHIYHIKSSHSIIQNAIANCMEFINKAEAVCGTAQAFTAPLRLFDKETTVITSKDVPRESLIGHYNV